MIYPQLFGWLGFISSGSLQCQLVWALESEWSWGSFHSGLCQGCLLGSHNTISWLSDAVLPSALSWLYCFMFGYLVMDFSMVSWICPLPVSAESPAVGLYLWVWNYRSVPQGYTGTMFCGSHPRAGCLLGKHLTNWAASLAQQSHSFFSGFLSTPVECVYLEGGYFLTDVLTKGTKVMAYDWYLSELDDRRALCNSKEAVGSLVACMRVTEGLQFTPSATEANITYDWMS